MIQAELKAARLAAGKSLAEIGKVLGLSYEGYRNKETATTPVTGTELARLADYYQRPLDVLFPSYRPTLGEVSLARHLASNRG
jgi:transcriptional regulator with XRE-family HTH domain